MTRKKAAEIRSQSKDGAYDTIEGYRKKRKSPAAGKKTFRQPEESILQRGTRTILEGHARLLGATIQGDGINFAVYSRHARDIFLILFDAAFGPPTDVIRLPARTGFVHHGFVEGLGPGQLYALRARGEFNPAKGLRFNEKKLLIDPYARAFAGSFRHDGNILLPYDPFSPEKDGSLDERDSADAVPKCIAFEEAFDWEGDAPLRIPMAETIIYEVHVKGFTAHASSGVERPGTYLGFIEKIPHLRELGVNAVELLPIHAKFPAEHEGDQGKGNYWGYHTFGFFAPEATYAAGKDSECGIREFKTLVKALHRAGIEVILDVVYNHSAEGNELGPLFSFKGLDNPSYYALTGSLAEPARYYFNQSGTGNTLDFGSPPVVRLALDSLRYWVEEMHVDGFRFDLCTVHGRGFWPGFEAGAPFFQALGQDPVLSEVKLIAEPWDCEGFEQGNFPVGWAEWNAKFRDNARKFIKGDAGQLNELGWRLTGSSDLFGDDGRGPDASINFVTCHDGFTLIDLVSYNAKHNQANGEDNRDGYNDNLSWNCGAEGESGDGAVRELRRRQVRNFACLLLFAQGTPMIGHGDEMLRSQSGNNNAYCQDNPLAWMDWSLLERHRDTFEFFKKAIDLRKRIPLLAGKKILEGKDGPAGIPDILWYGPEGSPLDWNRPDNRSLAFQLDGNEWTSANVKSDRRFYFIYNMDPQPREFALPILPPGRTWMRVTDTSLPAGENFLPPGSEEILSHPGSYRANGRSVVILKE